MLPSQFPQIRLAELVGESVYTEQKYNKFSY